MQHNYTLRKKDGGIQIIISYLYDEEMKWRTKSKQGFKKESDAKRWANDMLIDLQKMEGMIARTGKDMTLLQAGEMFVASRINRAPNTLIAYQNLIDNLEPYHNLKLRNLTPVKTQEFQKIVPQSYYNHIRAFFNYMKKMRMIEDNYLDLKKSEVLNDNRIVSKATYEKIIAECKNPEQRIFIKIAYRYGLRAGEILGMTPDRTFKDKIIINQQWQRIDAESRVYGLKELKNKSKGHRELPFDAKLYRELNAIPFNFAQGRYFSINTTSPVNYTLKNYNHSAHDFRHTRASEMVHEGFNLKYVAYFIGDTLETIMKKYVHLNDEMISQQNKKFVSTF